MNYSKILLCTLLTAAIGFSSCEKSFLEQQAPDQLTTDKFWRNKSDALSGLAAVYGQLEGATDWTSFIEARSVREYYREDYVVPGADADNYPWWLEHYNFNFTAGNLAVEVLWSGSYLGINFANQVIEKVGEMPDTKIDAPSKKMILGEAHFLRAYYYFSLAKNFQQLVLRDRVPKSDQEIGHPLSDKKAVWDFIVADLKEAAANLPLRSKRPNTEMGRATKGAAQAYLGKVYLYMAGEYKDQAAAYYKEAAQWLGEVKASGEYSLEADYNSMFNGTVKNSRESVFELQQSADESNGAYYKFMLNAWIGAREFKGYGEIYGTQRLVTEMTREGRIAADGNFDKRAYGTIYFNDAYFNDAQAKRVYSKTFTAWFKNNTDAVAFRKWLPVDTLRMQQANDINMPLMRYADVLLLYAEALNAADRTPEAIPVINDVRKRAGMPALTITAKEEVFKQLIHERVMELTMEGSRYYDLRRWGLLETNMKEAGRGYSADKAYYPLPKSEVDNNSGI
ncbi:RagB/SusD family nutrient uptake outer membrane protein [Chitinophaga solisilvae]|uniref:RagB/SusD family nutrient uptake outer membrane protein n=1 Tax=Chitinophaga solisilvae TaxID=1233460 RepID=A0A9Q5DF99_9BACT|nr:RagB/SusD family nutrient uptake outer membrane protein [Chitinophaga solisilvae]NSL90975.1 RagB/SusD family nutrient uptake outer membrane protein [Chitinophaga solisilvae]